jgi:choline monooxygenase
VPLVIVRGEDEDGRPLRALHNVCRHRAGPLATCAARGARALTCQYHGWTYGLDGRLRGAPEMGRAEASTPPRWRCRRRGWRSGKGSCSPRSDAHAPPFEALVEGIDARLATAGHALGDLRFHQRVSYDIDCDWKVYVDNYLEGYHVPRVHPALNAALDYASYRTDLARWHSLQSSPLDIRADALRQRRSAVLWLWPNTMLNCLPGRLQTNRVLPLGVGRCRVEFDFFYANESAQSAADAQFSDLVQHEDIAICTAVQRGLASGSYEAGRLNPLRESGVWHFHELLRSAYRDDAQR